MNTKMHRIGLFIGCGAALSVALVGCGDDADDSTEGGAGTESTAGADGSAGSKNTAGSSSGNNAGSGAKPGTGGEPAEPEPVAGVGGGGTPSEEADAVYALTTQVFGETEDQSYVLLTHELTADTQLSLDDAVIEIAGRALGTGPEDGSALFVAGELGPTITRYDLTPDGKLAGGSSVSFLGKGVTKFGEYGGQFQYISDEKAYWFDGPTAQVVVWNPKTMKVTGAVPLTGLAVENQVLSFTAAPVRDGDKLYSFVAWREGLAITQRVAVVIVDTKTEQVKIVESDGCGYVRDGVLSQGMLYMATEAFGSAAHYLDATNPKPCLLRLDTSDDTLDASFNVELASLSDGKSAGSLVVGPDNQAFLRVLDPSAIPEDVTNPRVLAGVAAWDWYKLTPGDEPTVSKVQGASLAGGSVLPFKLGARSFAPLFIAGEETEFLELTKDGPSEAQAITIPGLVFSAVKLR
jgi:hypothetical protein